MKKFTEKMKKNIISSQKILQEFGKVLCKLISHPPSKPLYIKQSNEQKI